MISYNRNSTTFSVRLDPATGALIDQEARRLGTTKSEVIKDAIERVLGHKDPAKLLRRVRKGTPMGYRDASENVAKQMKAKLRAQRSG